MKVGDDGTEVAKRNLAISFERINGVAMFGGERVSEIPRTRI